MVTIKIYKRSPYYNMQICEYAYLYAKCDFADSDIRGQQNYISFYLDKPEFFIRKS